MLYSLRPQNPEGIEPPDLAARSKNWIALRFALRRYSELHIIRKSNARSQGKPAATPCGSPERGLERDQRDTESERIVQTVHDHAWNQRLCVIREQTTGHPHARERHPEHRTLGMDGCE